MNNEIFKEFASKTIPVIQGLNKISGTFVTGSAAIGGFKPLKSDIDVVVPIQNTDDVGHLKAELGFQGFNSMPSDYNNGFKLVIPGQTIPVNIIMLHPFDYCAWLFATNTLANCEVIHDRNARHRAFELAVLLFKMASTSGRYTTVDGSCTYFDHSNSKCVMDVFNNIVSTYATNLPF